jgi:hypothetical protein
MRTLDQHGSCQSKISFKTRSYEISRIAKKDLRTAMVRAEYELALRGSVQ